MTDAECVDFLQWVLPTIHLRWPGFRRVRGQVRKRLARRMRSLGIEDVASYRELVQREASELEIVDRLCRITISRLWRDRAVFETLANDVLPELGNTRAWSAGCASGEEPYSLALAARRAGIDISIVATDADPLLLERAERARYRGGTLREVPADLRSCFAEDGDEFVVLPPITACVEFRLADLRCTAEAGPFDLVLCRNLAFTYFDETLQRDVLSRILLELRRGGYLVIGGHERLPGGAKWPLRPAASGCPIWRVC